MSRCSPGHRKGGTLHGCPVFICVNLRLSAVGLSIRGRFPQDPNRMSKIPTAAPSLVAIFRCEICGCSECWESAQRSRLSRRLQVGRSAVNMSDETNKNQALGTDAPTGLGSTSRRSFLSRIGTVGLMITAAPIPRAAPPATPESTSTPPPPSPPQTGMPVTLRINGTEHHLQLDPRTTLLDCLRENVGLTGTKKGCDHGQCGACTVHINGGRATSCLSFAVMHEGVEITTI